MIGNQYVWNPSISISYPRRRGQGKRWIRVYRGKGVSKSTWELSYSKVNLIMIILTKI
jgi:hypothetical protein